MIRYLYWVPAENFKAMAAAIRGAGLTLKGSKMTPCETLRADEETAIYATPQVFSRMCTRQGSWYRDSARNGQFMIVSPMRLAGFDAYYDAEIAPSDFRPDQLPSAAELLDLVQERAYTEGRPEAWEKKTRLDAIMVRLFFRVIGYWGRKDTLDKHWLTHRANHANFVAERYTTDVDGEKVPYSISEVAGVCSSCVEFFNIANPERRKLVRACPGAVTFGNAPKEGFLDISPARKAA